MFDNGIEGKIKFTEYFLCFKGRRFACYKRGSDNSRKLPLTLVGV